MTTSKVTVTPLSVWLLVTLPVSFSLWWADTVDGEAAVPENSSVGVAVVVADVLELVVLLAVLVVADVLDELVAVAVDVVLLVELAVLDVVELVVEDVLLVLLVVDVLAVPRPA